MTGEEARRLLEAARAGEARAERGLLSFLGGLLLVWGTVYALGYGLLAARAPWADAAWAGLDLAGFLLSFALGARQGASLRTPAGRQLARIWLGFGLCYLALVLSGGLAGPAFSLAINLLVALAWMASGAALERAGAYAVGAVFAALNAATFALAPGLYAPVLAAVGALAAVFGLSWVRRGLR